MIASAGIGTFARNSNGAFASLNALISLTSSRLPVLSLNLSIGTEDSYGVSFPGKNVRGEG